MAEALPQPLGRQLAAFTALPMQRQFGLLLGVAMAIAVAASLAVWGMRPTYRPLLPGLAERDVVEAMSVLSREGIPHRLDPATGVLTVPAKRMHEARLQLATEGLPHAQGVGFELLEGKSPIGSSRMVEAARYQRALEGELARSITTLESVESARVHLALPRQSVFVRDRVKPGASVLINLRSGRTLDERQIAGIVHMVASSIPELTPERVTVVDQRGRLLTAAGEASGAALPGRQLDYTRELEEALRRRVESLLSPLVGEQGMRVEVTAEVDFTRVESTHETYDPEGSVVRSEQITEDQNAVLASGGIPGALSNQPPVGATIADAVQLDAAALALQQGASVGEGAPETSAAPVNRSRQSIRNFEVDRTISHVLEAPATLERLSVAVVVDHRETVDEAGQLVRVPRGAEEMQYLTSLVQEAVGFDESRGDSVNVVNASFREIEQLEPLPAPPVWQEPWAIDLFKQAMTGLGVLLIVLLVLRPALKTLARQPVTVPVRATLAPPSGMAGAIGADGAAQGEGVVHTLEGRLEQARKLTREDPRLVAQVVRQWVHADEK